MSHHLSTSAFTNMPLATFLGSRHMIGSKPIVFTKAFVSPSGSDTMQIDDQHYPYSSKVVNLVEDQNKSIGIILDKKKKKSERK